MVTATSLFDGHDAAINIMRRIIQSQGASSSIQVFFHILQSLVIIVGLFILGLLISWKIFKKSCFGFANVFFFSVF